MRNFLLGTGLNARSTDAGLLVLRLFTGLALLFGHGLGKFPPSPRFIDGVGEMGFPLPLVFAWAAALSEVVGGALLAAGFLTRPASLFILCTVLTAGLIRHADDPFSGKEKAFLYAAVALLFLIAGAGRYSVDGRWGRKRGGVRAENRT